MRYALPECFVNRPVPLPVSQARFLDNYALHTAVELGRDLFRFDRLLWISEHALD
jgi:hypothetical protein